MNQQAHRSVHSAFLEEALETLQLHDHSPEAFQLIGDRLRKLATSETLITDRLIASLRVSDSAGAILTEASDGRGMLMLARVPSERPAPILNDHPWSISSVVRGRVRYLTWERRPQRTNPHDSGLRLTGELELNPGDFVYFPDLPAQPRGRQGIGDAWELRLIGQPVLAGALDIGSIAYASAA